METFDIILDQNGELQERNGDFLMGDNANNLLRYLIEANKGEYKEFPLTGVGIETFLNTTKNAQQISRDILTQLNSDVFPSPDIDLNEWPPTINVNKTTITLDS